MSIVGVCLFVLGIVACLGVSAQEPARITVYPAQEIGSVNRLLFGNNQLAYQDGRDEYANRGAGIWDPEQRRPVPEYVLLAKQCGMTVSRWPGGCAAHTYNWKKTVGSLADRTDQAFGLPEFLAWCRATGTVPLLTLAAYWGGPGDAADLVEYLNAPNDGSNPNGGRDWAALRAADGHPLPHGVVWFEYGNESYHGPHGETGAGGRARLTPMEYAEGYRAYRSAMRAVDERVKLGALIQHDLDGWNRTILEEAGQEIDFAVDHTYLPVWSKDAEAAQSRLLLQAATACGAQLQDIYDRLNRIVERRTGREDLPWAITEYNGHYVQSQPVAYRQTLANALRNALHLQIMMQPRNRVIMANFWQFANEYWGMVQGYVHRREPLVPQANFLVFQLYAEHFGETLIQNRTVCGTWEFEGAAGVLPRHGEQRPLRLIGPELLDPNLPWTIQPLRGVRQQLRGRALMVEFPGADVNYHHAAVTLPAKPDAYYRVKGMIRTRELSGSGGACFQVGDHRGWTLTNSCAISNDVAGTEEWREIEMDYRTLPDTEAVTVMARRVGEDGGPNPVSGTAWYVIESVREFAPENFGAVPDLSVNTAKRGNGAVTLMLVNTNFDRDLDVNIEIAGALPRRGSRAGMWLLSGTAPWANNIGGVTPRLRIVTPAVRETPGGWSLAIPRHAMAAVEIAP